MLLADFAGLAIDHARRFSGSEAQRVALQQTVDALDATIQIARALGGETDLDASSRSSPSGAARWSRRAC